MQKPCKAQLVQNRSKVLRGLLFTLYNLRIKNVQELLPGGVCRLTYCNPKQIGGIPIAKLVVAEKPSVAMSYAKVLGATSRQDGYLEGNGYLVSWCVGHLVELAPPNIYDAKYVKWSIADLPILPQKWQYLVSASTKKQFGILQKLMHRPDVDNVICATDAG